MVNRLFETKSFVSNFASFSKRYCSGSSHQRCSVKKDVLETFANFTGKNLCWNFFLITLPQPATLLKKKLCYRCFSEKFANSLRTPFFLQNTFGRLLLLFDGFCHIFRISQITLSWRRPLSYKNQSTDLQSKSMDWFLYDNGLRHENNIKMGAMTKWCFTECVKLSTSHFWGLVSSF